MAAEPPTIGQRIAAARTLRRMSQPDLAAAAHLSLSALRKLEQGSRPITDRSLAAISDALGVEPERLTGSRASTDSRVHAAVPALRHAVDAYDLPDDGPTRPLPELARAVHEATQQRLASQYTRLSHSSPPLLAELSRAVHGARSDDQRAAARLLTVAYRSADAVAYKHGYYDLAARLVELMRWSSRLAEDPVLAATVAYVRTEVFFGSRNLAPGLRALQDAIGACPKPTTPAAIAALGSLHMRAAVVAARLLEDQEVADEHMTQASRLAALVPESTYGGTAFGPDSLRVHQVSLAVELGDGERAIRAAGDWRPPDDMPAERRSHFFVELARAWLWLGRRSEAFASLVEARRIAPQHVREHPQVRDVIVTLLRLHRAPSHALLSYAEWVRAI